MLQPSLGSTGSRSLKLTWGIIRKEEGKLENYLGVAMARPKQQKMAKMMKVLMLRKLITLNVDE